MAGLGGQVLVAPSYTGICGTDLHIQDDEFPSTPPVVMGHEVTGRVVEAGQGAEDGQGLEVLAAEQSRKPREHHDLQGGQVEGDARQIEGNDEL